MLNCHHVQPTVLSVGIGSYLREVSIADFWDSYYQPTNQILKDLRPPDFERNYHPAQPTVLSVGICSDITMVSITNFWDIYYQPNPPSIFHPLFHVELSSGTTHSSVRWNRLRVQRGVNCLLLRHFLCTKSSPDPPPTFSD